MNKAYQTPRSMLVMMNSFLRCNALMDQRIKSAIAGGTLKRGTWGRASGAIRRLAGGPGSPALCPLPRVVPRGPLQSPHLPPSLGLICAQRSWRGRREQRATSAASPLARGSRGTWEIIGRTTFLQEASVRLPSRSSEKATTPAPFNIACFSAIASTSCR